MDKIDYTNLLAKVQKSYEEDFLQQLDFKDGDYIQIDIFDHGVLSSTKRMKISWMCITHIQESIVFQITGHKISDKGHMKKDSQSATFNIEINMPNGVVISPYTDYKITVLSEEKALSKLTCYNNEKALH